MVTRTPGFTTRGGQFVVDEESALIAEAMEEIISTIPELALVASKIQANLRSLCLHTRDLAAYYAKNHPRMSGETTPETTPPMPAKIDRVFWVDRHKAILDGIASGMGKSYAEVAATHVRRAENLEEIESELNADPPVEPNNVPVINPADWVEMPFQTLPVEGDDEPRVDYI